MTVFLRELKANRKTLIIWCVCMFLLVASGMGKYTTYSSGSAGSLSDVFKEMPYTVRALLGIGSFDVTTMGGYFAMLFLYIEIAVAIHAVLLGSGIIAKEERDKTSEFLMVKPLSRTSIITSKLLAALVNIVILNIVTLLSSLVMVSAYNKGADISGEIMTFMVSMLMVQLIFLSLGAFCSAFLRNAKSSGSAAMGIMLGSFVIAEITNLTDHVNVLNVLSPFKYFSYADIVNGNGLNAIIVVLSLLLIAVFSAAAYFFYRKRDLSV